MHPIFASVCLSGSFVPVTKSVLTDITSVKKDSDSSHLVGLLRRCTEMSWAQHRAQHPCKQWPRLLSGASWMLAASVRRQGEAMRGHRSPGGAWVLLRGPAPHAHRWQEHFFCCLSSLPMPSPSGSSSVGLTRLIVLRPGPGSQWHPAWFLFLLTQHLLALDRADGSLGTPAARQRPWALRLELHRAWVSNPPAPQHHWASQT